MPDGGDTSPLTRTDPDAISSSAARLLATPDRARKRFSLSNHAASASPSASDGRLGQMVERFEAHHLQEAHGRAVQLRLAGTGPASDLGDEVTQLEVGEHALAIDAPHIFDFRARNRLLVRDDRQRLVCGSRELARDLGAKSPPHRCRKRRARGEVKLVVMAHQHDAPSVEGLAQLAQRVLDRGAIAVSRMLQLTQGEGSVGAEENRLDRRRERGQALCLVSIRIGPNRSFCRTLISERRSSSSTATNVTTASSRSSDSRISSSSSMGPSPSLRVMRSSFSSRVQVRPVTTTGRGGMRAKTLLNATTRRPISRGSSWPAASTGRAGGGNENESWSARSIRPSAICLYARYSSSRLRTSSSHPSRSVSSSVGASPGSSRIDLRSSSRAAIQRNSAISGGSATSRVAISARYASVTRASETWKMSTSSRSASASSSSSGPSNTGVLTSRRGPATGGSTGPNSIGRPLGGTSRPERCT